MQLFHFQKGFVPILFVCPGSGTFVPLDLVKRMTPEALELTGPEKFLPQLFGSPELEQVSILAGMLSANLSRHVVDLDALVDQDIVPLQTQSGHEVYLADCQPDQSEIVRRVEHFYKPFRKKIDDELKRLQKSFSSVVLIRLGVREFASEQTELGLVGAEEAVGGEATLHGKLVELVNANSSVEWSTELGSFLTSYSRSTNEDVIPLEIVFHPQSFLNEQGLLDDESRARWASQFEPIFEVIRECLEAS